MFRHSLRSIGAVAVLCALSLALPLSASQADAAAPAKEAGPKLNFVFFLIDDLGWTDLGCFGSKFYETPNIDRLARQGMRFTDAYAACCVCSPTRASVLTGKYPARLRLTDWIAGHNRPFAKLSVPDWTMYLPHEEVTLAEALKQGGYATAAIGKWHLGGKQYTPESQGFDVNVGGDHRGQPPSYYWPYQIPSIPGGGTGEYLTDRLTDDAEKFIETNREKPFFLYFAHYAVHTPVQAKQELIEKYRRKDKPEANGDGPIHENPSYAGMIESVDDSVGRVMKKLDDLKIADRTVIVFTSDNGGLLRITGNAPLRAGKGSPWEGGMRVPLLVVWPGVVKPGSECSMPVSSIDFYPTLLEIAGIKGDRKHNATVDGKSLVPLLRQSGTLKRDAIFWHYPHYHPGGATPYGAVRKGDYKLIEFYEDGGVELYNLKKDVGEKENLAEKMPQKVAELRKLLDQWLEKVDAQLPEDNPDYNPARDGRPGAKPAPKEPAEVAKEPPEEPKKPPEPKNPADEPKPPAKEAKAPAEKPKEPGEKPKESSE